MNTIAQAFADACGADTVLACAMQVNNETGHIQDVAAIGAALAGRGVPLHVDAAQALGKVPVRVGEGIGSMAFSGQKFGAPVGVGALYLRSRPRVGIEPLQFGGGQERGLRAGTLAVPMTEALVAAAKAAEAARQAEQQRLDDLYAQQEADAKKRRNRRHEERTTPLYPAGVDPGIDS